MQKSTNSAQSDLKQKQRQENEEKIDWKSLRKNVAVLYAILCHFVYFFIAIVFRNLRQFFYFFPMNFTNIFGTYFLFSPSD